MPPQCADLDHQFVAFLEQAHFPFCREGQLQPDFIMSVAFGERVRRLRARNRGGILVSLEQHARHFLQALASQHLPREQRHLLHRHRREI